MATGPFKCYICYKEFLTNHALISHTTMKHDEEDIWERAGNSGGDVYVPVTPGGTILTELAASTEKEAIANLLKEAAHMPYDGWDSPDGYGFKQRGYEICKAVPSKD